MAAGTLAHEPASGLRIAGAARARGRELEGGLALSAEEALAELSARTGVDAPPDFDPERFGRSSGVAVRDWCPRTGAGPVELAVLAVARALEAAAWDPASVGALIAATSTPEAPTKCMAAAVAARLGAGGAAIDVRSGGAGGLEALLVGAARVSAAGRVVVVAAEAPSRYANPHDPTNALLFGDGAAALCLETGGTGSIAFGRSARYDSPGRAFSVRAELPPGPSGGPLWFDAPDARYVEALGDAWTHEAGALRSALERNAAEHAAFAPYFVHARQLERAETGVGRPAPVAHGLLADGGSIGCAAPLAALAELMLANPDLPIATLAVGGGISACSALWSPTPLPGTR